MVWKFLGIGFWVQVWGLEVRGGDWEDGGGRGDMG